MSSNPLVILGLGDIADMAFTFFTEDSAFDIVAYTVDEAYRHRTEFHDRPVVPYEVLRGHYDPAEVTMFVAAGYGENNRTRDRLIARARADGWSFASYVASRVGIWDATVGRNCMVHDGNVLQPGARIGDGTILCPNCVVGENTAVGACCYVGPIAVIGAYVDIGDRCVVGPQAHVASHVSVGHTSFIGASSRVYARLPAHSLLLEPGTKPMPYTTDALPPLLRDRLYQSRTRSGGGRSG